MSRVTMIGGYIAKKISMCLKCAECAAALAMEDVYVFPQTDHTYCSSSRKADLISFKSYGQPKRSTPSLVKVVKVADRHIRLIKKITDLYSKIFLHRFAKVYSERIVRQEKPSQRNKLTFGHG